LRVINELNDAVVSPTGFLKKYAAKEHQSINFCGVFQFRQKLTIKN